MKDDADHARAWLIKADNDFAAIQRLIAAGGPFDVACFHSQQAAEKYLKAALVAVRHTFPKTHNLSVLGEIVLRLYPQFRADTSDLEALTPYAVELRHDVTFLPSERIASRALTRCEAVRIAVLAVLHPLLNTPEDRSLAGGISE